MSIQHVGIIGAGAMGSGIAQVSAQAGFTVTIYDLKEEFLETGINNIDTSLSRLITKEKITSDDKKSTFEKINGTLDITSISSCDIVIEAVSENLQIKQELFQKLDKICDEKTILATNTSSLTILEIAQHAKRRDKILGLHFFNPVPMMPLVEVVKTIQTSKDTLTMAFAFCKTIKKTTIEAKDNCGFVVNLLLVPYLLDAIRIYCDGYGSIEDIDNGMQLGCGHPMGPFTLLDFIGLDVIYDICDILYDEYKEKRYSAPPLLKRMILAKMYGIKTGIGFYCYNGKDKIVNPNI